MSLKCVRKGRKVSGAEGGDGGRDRGQRDVEDKGRGRGARQHHTGSYRLIDSQRAYILSAVS